jgi:hypothetical protein
MFRIYRLSFFCIILVTCLAAISAQPADNPANSPVLSRIIINYDSVLFPGFIHKDNEVVFGDKLVLTQHENNIEFELHSGDTVEYRYFLKGFDKEWTPWQKNKIKEYRSEEHTSELQSRCVA